MTKVYLSNVDNTWQSATPSNVYYIEIETTKIEYDKQIEPVAILRKYITKNQWPGTPETAFIDFLHRPSAVTIYGSIDKYSNRTSGWAASAVNDASVVRKRIEWMQSAGGTVKLIVGLGDGYYNRANALQTGSCGGSVNGEVYEGLITTKFTEDTSDHADRTSDSESYPSATKAIVNSYDLVLTLQPGTIR